ncbi:hypothetical protein LCGC14_2999560 [marine sediment metagenome]|uniref:Uncharacterized protein n=1 Tax=marine sediment metagenome TaxID=412755 RepID=A0A0F8Z923_9ZZZZ
MFLRDGNITQTDVLLTPDFDRMIIGLESDMLWDGVKSMAGNFTEIRERPNDKERQDAYKTGVAGYGGNEDSTLRGTPRETVRQTSLPNGES